ncbi:hypothetical protein JKI95_04390 [Corynebacterium aquatimens]|nr:hypothetical protein JKI95_04390 [Corynebacterium aquatimens]UIZ92566.1 hypothetical protein JZY91_01800 [Corynebacterium sp. CNCTC7651]
MCVRREDLKNWKTNHKKSGFLPHERAFMDAVFGCYPDDVAQDAELKDLPGSAGAVDYVSGKRRKACEAPACFDVARRLNPEDANLLERAQRAWVDKVPSVEERWSDHSPLVVEYR